MRIKRKAVWTKERNNNRRGILSQAKVDQELIVENKDKLLDKHIKNQGEITVYIKTNSGTEPKSSGGTK